METCCSGQRGPRLLGGNSRMLDDQATDFEQIVDANWMWDASRISVGASG
jgi:hypothetical protein